MRPTALGRRDFHKLTAAAFGGLLVGNGCADGVQHQAAANGDDKPEIFVDPAQLLQEPNVCRGLNTCQGQGKGEHDCAGQGACAMVAEHACRGENDCKGQGGCGGYPGQNTCDGKGHCAVPLKEATWAIARKQLEHLMSDAGKKLGAAPER